MSLRYIIDGYNVVKKSQAWKDKNLEEARDLFLRFLQTNKISQSLRNNITVVFDALHNPGNYVLNEDKKKYGNIKIIFSRSKDADGVIVEMVDRMPNPKNAVVITDDRQLGYRVRAQGALWVGVDEFLRKKEKKLDHKSDNIKLLPSLERKITEELSRFWLKEE